jgi:hypothetical protein
MRRAVAYQNPYASTRCLLLPLAVYLIWIIATYLLEGRIHQMQGYDPFERAAYIIIANIAVGTILASWAIKTSSASLSISNNKKDKIESKYQNHTLLAVVIASALGLVLFIALNPSLRDPISILNAFCWVLPVSIAELLVCWALVGVSFERLFQPKGRALSILAGILVADIFFALYHFAHSPPFNQPKVVLFLLIPGLLTGLFYFLGRDLYGAIAIQNFLGMIGVSRNLDLEFFSQPLYPIYLLALLALFALIASLEFIKVNNK